MRVKLGEEVLQDGLWVTPQEAVPSSLCASAGLRLSRFLHRPCLYFLIMTYFLNKRGFSSGSSADKLSSFSREAGCCLFT